MYPGLGPAEFTCTGPRLGPVVPVKYRLQLGAGPRLGPGAPIEILATPRLGVMVCIIKNSPPGKIAWTRLVPAWDLHFSAWAVPAWDPSVPCQWWSPEEPDTDKCCMQVVALRYGGNYVMYGVHFFSF